MPSPELSFLMKYVWLIFIFFVNILYPLINREGFGSGM